MLRILTQVTIDTNLTPKHTIVSFLPSFRLAPLSSTHQFHTKGPLLSSPQNPSILHQKLLSSTPKAPGFNTENPSVQHIPQFNTKNPSVPHRKPLSSTHPSVQHQKVSGTEGFSVCNWGGFGVELRGFWCGTEGLWCWTEGFLVWNWGVFGVELRDFWVIKRWGSCVEPLCWTEGVCVELRCTPFRPIWHFKCSRMLNWLKSCQFVKFHIVL